MASTGISLSTTARSLVRSTFFGKDFESYVNELTDFIKLRFGTAVASNIVASEQGIMLIEMFSFGLSTLSWYGDRQADDTNLRDVRLRTAAVTIARQLGYKAKSAIPATVALTLTLDNAPTLSRLTIERGRVMLGPGGLLFEVAEEVIFEVGEVGPKSFSAREGQTIEEVFISNSEPDQFFLLASPAATKSIAQSTARVFVNSLEWFEEDLLAYEQTNQFEMFYGLNPPRLQFGDGVAGNIPPNGAEIRISYLQTSGTNGAVTSQAVVTFREPLVAGTQVLTGTVSQPDPSTPGSSPESVASIKSNAPLLFQTAQRAVTQKDYDALINAFVDPIYGAVAIGRSTVPRSVEQDAEAMTIIGLIESAGVTTDVVTRLKDYWDKVLSSNCEANVVVGQILAADSVGRYVSAPAGLAVALEEYLDAKAESTVKVRVTDGTTNLLSVDLLCELKLLTGYTSDPVRESIKNQASTILQAQLIGREYGVSLRIGDLYSLIEAIEGIDYSNIKVSAVNGNSPTLYVNGYGDLPITDYQVITLGTQVTVNLI